ncbi:hypothetical protein BIV59_15240 [Bacillus sp. MUM 13]|nr:hypothetical protein BIV59_15240 [Bacillus sp. MUM 13]
MAAEGALCLLGQGIFCTGSQALQLDTILVGLQNLSYTRPGQLAKQKGIAPKGALCLMEQSSSAQQAGR